MNDSETRFLGLDIGTKRVGLALTDTLKITAQPFKTLEYTSNTQVLKDIKSVISSQNVEKIIVGLPIGLDGLENPQCKIVRDFTKKMQQTTGLDQKDFIFHDERLTSVEASRILKDKKLKNKERRKVVDKIAASLILANYLNSTSNHILKNL